MTVVDLYAGPGGWDCAAHQLGLDPIGIEIDADTCATRAAAGLRTIRARVGEWWPTGLRDLAGLIASPPCQIFSNAGTRTGIDEVPRLVRILDGDETGPWDRWAPAIAHQTGQISLDAMLVLDPARWVDRWEPRWVAIEQVPSVLPVWEAVARWLTRRGYSAWAGALNAADYGVPQTRRRAILIAHRDRPVAPPEPTHAEYPQASLFGPAPDRWVSLAEALDLDPDTIIDLRQNSQLSGGRTKPYKRSAARTSATITGRSARGQWLLDRREHTGWTKPTPAAAGPAPTVTGRSAERNWVLYREVTGPNDRYIPRTLDQPAPTVTAGATVKRAWELRPATTIAGDLQCWPPGHKINQNDIDRLGEAEARARYGDRAGTDAIRLTVAQAAALQTFPPDWPWQGTKTSQAQQIGNAVPVLLAKAILAEVIR